MSCFYRSVVTMLSAADSFLVILKLSNFTRSLTATISLQLVTHRGRDRQTSRIKVFVA